MVTVFQLRARIMIVKFELVAISDFQCAEWYRCDAENNKQISRIAMHAFTTYRYCRLATDSRRPDPHILVAGAFPREGGAGFVY